jgi:hypothetical protein
MIFIGHCDHLTWQNVNDLIEIWYWSFILLDDVIALPDTAPRVLR